MALVCVSGAPFSSHSLRGSRLVPLRSEIDPRGIERALDNTFLLERIAPGLARFRLAGKVLNSLLDMEVRGMPITALFRTDDRDAVRSALNALFEGPEVVSIQMTVREQITLRSIAADLKLFPLKSDLGDLSRALGCISIHGQPANRPGRLAIETLSTIKLSGETSEKNPISRPMDELSGFKERPVSFDHKQRVQGSGTTHLRVIKGGK